jgi:shikimate kinase
MNLILFGFKGSGKTHFGKLLAKELQRPFIDTDELIITLDSQQSPEKKQRSVRTIHQSLGDPQFRSLEHRAILTLKGVQNSIIALGGGAVLSQDNLHFLQTLGTLVYLEASFALLQKRILDQGIPSFISSSDSVASLHRLYEERKLIYEAISCPSIHVEQLSQAEVIQRLSDLIHSKEEHSHGF